MRALVVTNMPATPERPARGRFVRDQVAALQRLEGVEVELFAFPPGLRSYPRAALELRRRFRGERFDVVHAHFGLTAWPALALRGAPHVVTFHGTDLAHPRSRRLSLAALPLLALAAAASAELARRVPGAGSRRRVAVLPCGVDLERFRPLPRGEARARLGLAPDEPLVLFPADPARAEKRADHARAVVDGRARLLTLGEVDPDEVPWWVNAANAVVIPSEREGFGLAVLEALACDVPVLATPTGIAPLALEGVEGALCAAFDEARWRAALAPHLAASDPRVAGRARAELFSVERMAERVAVAWRAVAAEAGGTA